MAATSVIDAGVCEHLVTAAIHSCPAVASAAPAVAKSDTQWDALANSFASLSAAFAWGSILLALLAVALAVGWGYLVKGWAEKEARQEAAECVKAQMDKWRTEEAPGLVRHYVDLLQNTTLGNKDEAAAADEMGKEAG